MADGLVEKSSRGRPRRHAVSRAQPAEALLRALASLWDDRASGAPGPPPVISCQPHPFARARSTSRSREFFVIRAARSNSARASVALPSFAGQIPADGRQQVVVPQGRLVHELVGNIQPFGGPERHRHSHGAVQLDHR